MDPLRKGFGASGLHGWNPVRQHGAEDLHHLPVPIRRPLQLAPDLLKGSGQDPVFERGAIAQRTGFAKQNRHIVPRIVDRPVPSKVSGVIANQTAILPDLDPLGIGADLDGPPDRRRRDRVFSVVEPHEARLRHRRWQRMEAIETASIGDQMRALFLEHFPDGLVRYLGMFAALGRSDAFGQQPGIQFLVAFDPDTG